MCITKETERHLLVAMATLLAPGSFCGKTKYANLQPSEKGQRVLLGTHVSYIVLILPIRLLGVDDPCLR